MPQDTLRETVGRIAGLARAGRMDEAAMLAASVKAVAGQDPVYLSLVGAVELHRGQYARAADFLGDAHRQRPSDITVRANLVDALFRAGREDDAYRYCDAAAAGSDRTLRIARIGGHLAQAREEFAEAAAFFRLALAADPQDWSSWNNLGNCLGPLGQHDDAVAALRKAAALAPDSQPIRMNLGNALIEAGQGLEAEKVLQDAARYAADDPKPHMALFTLYGLAGREDAAFDAVVEAARRAPDDLDMQAELAQEAVRRNDFAIAEKAFQAILQRSADDAQAFIGLATIYERMNREDELDPLHASAIALNVAQPAIAFIDALRFKRANRYEEAFAALERAGDVIAPGRTHHLRGVLLDRLGRHDEAFAAFTAMNAHWKEDPVRPLERAEEYRSAVTRATARLTPDWFANWTPFPAATKLPSPVFILGFPRSGTTLLDTMLMADPTVRVLEEEPIIGEIEQEIGGFDALASLSDDALLAARQSYYDRAGKIVDLVAGTRIVDKHPMHINKAEVIQRIFPDARFILALRHPCDVLLSCFLTNFRNNHAMANFLDLETAAELYDLSFTHWHKAQTLFSLDVQTVVYERLVEDTERELRPVFDWLGLAWPEEQFDHTRAARARGMVSTASYAQVTEPIYKRAAGRWQRYASHLAPILPKLAPWVDRFGYGLDDGRIPDWPSHTGTAE